ncbi:hypothetical protein Ppro_1368 [Pelobacter propionicus DSM 2379]|uniref:Uncharacterized protein n=2 Tax=Pelobacter propionicus TaxID=29543 RepID=A1ANR5_PELPD|nr:hypothetical protein Ppro_1368 [Pelobacter propionicus DSM 2379]
MIMARTYQTRNIEQASAIKTIARIDPEISFDESAIATFTFPETSEVIDVVLRYEAGIMANARTLLNTRNQLFRRVKGGRR